MKLHPTDISGRGFKRGFDIWKQPKFSVRMMWFFCFVCAVSSCPRSATYGWKKYRSLSSELLCLLKMIPWGSCWGVPMWPALLAIATTYIPPELQSFLPPSFLPSLAVVPLGFFFSAPIPKDFQVFICNKHFYTYLAERKTEVKRNQTCFIVLVSREWVWT